MDIFLTNDYNEGELVIHASIGAALKALRRAHNYVQSYVAAALGISVSAYSHYECDNRLPDVASLVKLANLYNINVDYLFLVICLDLCDKTKLLGLDEVFLAFSHNKSIPPQEAHILSVYNRLSANARQNFDLFLKSICNSN
jgi:transcriptional regulator with XRE-family HTH domain